MLRAHDLVRRICWDRRFRERDGRPARAAYEAARRRGVGRREFRAAWLWAAGAR